MTKSPHIRSFYHEPTFTWTHLAWDPETGSAVIIDPVLDYDQASGRTSMESSKILLDLVDAESLSVGWILETHAHADHLTSAARLKHRLNAAVAIGAGIRSVQAHFRAVFNLPGDFPTDGAQFDKLVDDEDRIPLGNLELRVLHTPGHTDDSVTYVIGDCAFIGDTLFAPDYGTARCDFPGGDARRLYRSIQRIYALGDETKLFLCHDYPAEGSAARPMTTVAEHRAGNVHIRNGISEDQFVSMRDARDACLDMPALILPSIQVNIRAGHLPPAESNGLVYLKIPVDAL